MDRERDGSLHLIDYKTGNVPSEIDWRQLQLHALILSQRLPWPMRRLSYFYLGPSVLKSVETSANELEAVRWEPLGLATKVRREKRYLPNPGPWCGGCDFNSICPRGDAAEAVAVVEGQLELWDEFPEEWRSGYR